MRYSGFRVIAEALTGHKGWKPVWRDPSLIAREDSPQSLFGIVQGACYEDLRRQSAATLCEMPFDGGVAIYTVKSGDSQILITYRAFTKCFINASIAFGS